MGGYVRPYALQGRPLWPSAPRMANLPRPHPEWHNACQHPEWHNARPHPLFQLSYPMRLAVRVADGHRARPCKAIVCQPLAMYYRRRVAKRSHLYNLSNPCSLKPIFFRTRIPRIPRIKQVRTRMVPHPFNPFNPCSLKPIFFRTRIPRIPRIKQVRTRNGATSV